MSKIAKKLASEIHSLSDIEKLHLVDYILSDLDKPDPEIDRVWAEEARKRWAAYKSGRIPESYVKEKIADGIKAAEEGRVVSHEDVKKKFLVLDKLAVAQEQAAEGAKGSTHSQVMQKLRSVPRLSRGNKKALPEKG